MTSGKIDVDSTLAAATIGDWTHHDDFSDPFDIANTKNNSSLDSLRRWRNGLDTKVEKSRKQMKERKNRAKKIRGVKKAKAGDAAKAGNKK